MPYLGNGLTKFTTADDLTVSGDAAIDTTFASFVSLYPP